MSSNCKNVIAEIVTYISLLIWRLQKDTFDSSQNQHTCYTSYVLHIHHQGHELEASSQTYRLLWLVLTGCWLSISFLIYISI
ncbi:unnamed protein product [Schistosoma intercalatum]|nr:unnamed protein product [Schistosoma intercalatum]